MMERSRKWYGSAGASDLPGAHCLVAHQAQESGEHAHPRIRVCWLAPLTIGIGLFSFVLGAAVR